MFTQVSLSFNRVVRQVPNKLSTFPLDTKTLLQTSTGRSNDYTISTRPFSNVYAHPPGVNSVEIILSFVCCASFHRGSGSWKSIQTGRRATGPEKMRGQGARCSNERTENQRDAGARNAGVSR